LPFFIYKSVFRL